MHGVSESSLKSINRSLLIIIIMINSFLLLAPLWPALTFAVQSRLSKPIDLHLSAGSSQTSFDTSYNHLIVPRMKLDERIYDGTSESTVHRGVWRRPNLFTPGQGNNTVMVGHRFTYSGASVFYHLDTLRPGDDVVVIYNQKVYVYRVDKSREVAPNDTTVEVPTTTERLTLYTCTPLGTLKNRLVVTAHLEKKL